MIIQLDVIDASREDWQERSDWDQQVAHAVRQCKNFLVVFNPAADGLAKLAELINCSPTALPQRLSKLAIYGLREVLSPAKFEWLMKVCNSLDVRFVEQLRLPCNRVPERGRFLVYCELCGILKDCDDPEQAAAVLTQIKSDLPDHRRKMVQIYQWEQSEWTPLIKQAEVQTLEPRSPKTEGVLI